MAVDGTCFQHGIQSHALNEAVEGPLIADEMTRPHIDEDNEEAEQEALRRPDMIVSFASLQAILLLPLGSILKYCDTDCHGLPWFAMPL